ncbi:hypothetical protein ScPMuIL_015628 [Solemya velum]
MEDLRSWFDVPGIAHFCSLFRISFELTDFDIEDLEDGLIAAGSEEGSPFLAELISRLLCGCYGRTDIYHYNFEVYLKDILKHRYVLEVGKPNPLEDPDCTFRELDLFNKVQILKKLCDFRLDAEDVTEQLKGHEGDNMRLEPLGKDAAGASYWYFYGVRLYKEDAEPQPQKEEPKSKKKQRDKKVNDKKKKKKKGKLSKKKKGKEESNVRKSNRISKRLQDQEDSDDAPEEEQSEVAPVQEEEKAPECSTENVKDPVRWHLVCTTLEDWQALAESFKNSKVKCEKQLYQVITDSFLPEIPIILESRERERKKRLLEMAPRRSSNRLEGKRKEQEEQDKILADAQELEDKQRAEMEEERRKLQEAERIEQERRDREERQRAREERAKRLAMREERARLLAEGKEIPPELLYFGNSKERDDVSEKSELDDDTYASMLKVVETVRGHKDAYPFWDPVDVNEAPDYLEVIKKPMDFSTIEKKIHERRYISRNRFMSDFRLIFHNCRRYNGSSSPLADMASNVERFYRKSLKKYLPVEDFDSDEDFKVASGSVCKRGKQEQNKFRPKRAASSRAMEHLHDAFDEDLFNSSLNDQPFSPDDEDSNSTTSSDRVRNQGNNDHLESKIMEALVASKRAQAAADKVHRFKITGGKESNTHEMPVLLSHGTLLKNSERRPISWIIDGKKVPIDSATEKNILTERFTKKISDTGTFAALLEKNRLLQQAQKGSGDSPGTVRKSIIVIKRSGEKPPGGADTPGLSHIVSKFHQSGASVNVLAPSSPPPVAPISIPQTFPMQRVKASDDPAFKSLSQTQVSMSPMGQKIITVMTPPVGPPIPTSSPSPSPSPTQTPTHPVQIVKAGSGNDIRVVDGKLVIGGRSTGIPISGGTKIVYQGATTPGNTRKITLSSTGNTKIASPTVNIGSGGLTNTHLQTLAENKGDTTICQTNSHIQTIGSKVDTSALSSTQAVENEVGISIHSEGTSQLQGVETSSTPGNSRDLSNTRLHIGQKTDQSTTPSTSVSSGTTGIISCRTSGGRHVTESHETENDLNSSGTKKIITLTVNPQVQIKQQPKTVVFPHLKHGQNGTDIPKLNSHSESNQIPNRATSDLDQKGLSKRGLSLNTSPSVFDRIVDLPTFVEVINQNEMVGETVIKDNDKVPCDKMEVLQEPSEADIHSNRKRKNIFESFDSETAPNKTTRLSPEKISPEHPPRTSPGENNIKTCMWNMENKNFMKPTDILNSLSTKLGNKLSPSKISEYKCDSVGTAAGLSANCNNNGNTVAGVGLPDSITVNSKFTENQISNVITNVSTSEPQL